jgi:hypothetical protein
MKIEITKQEANVIQVAIDHLADVHTNVLADAMRTGDNEQVRDSYRILRIIEDLHDEITNLLANSSTI